MDFKDKNNFIEFAQFRRSILKKYHRFIKDKIVKNYKKAAIFVYWLNDYIEYLKAEETFNPSMNITYKRGQIIFVNFGYRIGNELGGNHYAIVIDVKNSRHSKTVTVVPLKSRKDKETKYSSIYHVPLGSQVKDLLYAKASTIMNDNFDKVLTASQNIENINLSKKDINNIKRNQRIASKILDYTQSLKDESVADIGQIITISKQRIQHPCKVNDVLTGIILSQELMNLIDEKIKHLYIN